LAIPSKPVNEKPAIGRQTVWLAPMPSMPLPVDNGGQYLAADSGAAVVAKSFVGTSLMSFGCRHSLTAASPIADRRSRLLPLADDPHGIVAVGLLGFSQKVLKHRL
jgi:hypothetical protein